MAIFRKGYRRYEGARSHTPAAWVIARQGAGQAWRSIAVRLIGLLQLLVFGGTMIGLLVALSAEETLAVFGGPARSFAERSRTQLDQVARGYYEGTVFLVCVTAIFIGAGLVASDLRSKALGLYLARPIRRPDYLLGKALVVPLALVPVALLPGLAMWTIVGLWQEPGQTMTYFRETLAFPERVGITYLVLAVSMTGVMLIASSFTQRSGMAMVSGLGGVIVGSILSAAVRRGTGESDSFLFALGIPRNALRPWRSMEGTMGWARRWQPDPTHIQIVAIGLFALGVFCVWWRTRSTEVTE